MLELFIIGAFLFFAAGGHAAQPALTLTPENTVVLRGPIEGNMVNAAQTKLYTLAKKRGDSNYPLYLVLDTPGGSITDGEDLIEYAKTIRNLHTLTLFAASMGSSIVEALPGQRYITSSGILMFHRAAVGLQGQIEDGEVESRLAFFKSLVRSMEERSSARMLMSLSDYKQKVKDEMWLNSRNSVAMHAADQVVNVRCSDELIEQKEILTLHILVFQIKLEFSGCPLFRTPVPVAEPENKQRFEQHKDSVKQKLSKGIL